MSAEPLELSEVFFCWFWVWVLDGVAWLTPICVFLGLLVFAGVVLEVPKRTVIEIVCLACGMLCDASQNC
jgi:hypothetical protein